MLDILYLDSGQVSQLQAVLLAAGRLFHSNSSVMQREFMSCTHQRV